MLGLVLILIFVGAPLVWAAIPLDAPGVIAYAPGVVMLAALPVFVIAYWS